MAICPYTDKEWEDLPHVVLTSELAWDPGQQDFNLNNADADGSPRLKTYLTSTPVNWLDTPSFLAPIMMMASASFPR